MGIKLTSVIALALVLTACESITSPEAPAAAGLFDGDSLFVDDVWRWVPVPSMRCRTGSSTGFGLRRAAGSRDLLILLQGGGACFNEDNCSRNADHFDETDFHAFADSMGSTGAFDASRPENPFSEWNVLFVPYCTGDFHAGDAPETAVPGVPELQDFVGLRNMVAMLRRIDHRARRADQVVLAGESAGGFGSILTYGVVADRLAPAPVDLLNDSGPLPPSDDVLSPAFQQQVSDLWNLSSAAPAGCEACAGPDGFEHFLPHHATLHPNRSFGLLAFRRDAALRWFFGSPSEQEYEDALFGIRPTLPDNAGTYYVEGYDHLFLLRDHYYTTTVEGSPLTDWVAAFLAGQVTDVPVAPSLAVVP